MPRFRATINGENFLIDMDGNVAKYGFLTFRDVDAADPQAAELAAVQVLRDDQALRTVIRNAKDDPPTMTVTELSEVEEGGEDLPSNFIYYPMEPSKRWWQFWKR